MTPTIQDQKDYYDQRWANVGYCNRLELARCSAILAALYKTGLKEPRILDLGCGTGWMTAILGQFGPTTGWELSPATVEAARRRYPHVKFEAVDISAIDGNHFAPQFDVIVSQEVIEHFEHQNHHVTILCELLRKGGFLILTTPNARTFYAMPRQQRETWSNQPIENWLTMRQLKSLLIHFEIIEATTIIHGCGQAGLYRLVNSVKLVQLMDGLGLREWFDRLRSSCGFGLHMLVLSRKV